MEDGRDGAPAGARKGGLLVGVALTVGGCAAFLPYSAHAMIAPGARLPFWTLVSLVLLAVALVVWRRGEGPSHLSPAWAVFVAATANLLSWWPTERVRAGLTAEPQATQSLATAVNAAIVCLTIVVLVRLAGGDLGSLGLKRGRAYWWLPVGLTGMALFAVTAIPGATEMFQGQALTAERVRPWVPWVLLFVLSNGLREELLFRGLLLPRFATGLGTRGSIGVTSLVFALAHAGVTYTPQILPFLGITFVLGVLFAVVMVRTDSLWGAVLLHGGADIPVVLGMFSGP